MIALICLLVFVAGLLLVLGTGGLLAGRRVISAQRLRTHTGVIAQGGSIEIYQRAMSSIRGYRWVLERVPLATWLDTQLQRAGAGMNVGSYLATVAIISLGLGLVFWIQTGTIEAGVLSSIGGAAMPFGWLHWQQHKRMLAFEKQFPDALDMMVNALKSGVSLPAALGIVADEAPDPVQTEFRILLHQHKFGIDQRQSLAELRRRVDLVDAHLFATALLVQQETGGNLAEVLGNIAAVIRDRFRIMGDARTLTSEGRMSGIVLGALPLVLAIVLSFLQPGYLRFFVETGMGKGLLVTVIVSQVLGMLIMRKIVSIKV